MQSFLAWYVQPTFLEHNQDFANSTSNNSSERGFSNTEKKFRFPHFVMISLFAFTQGPTSNNAMPETTILNKSLEGSHLINYLCTPAEVQFPLPRFALLCWMNDYFISISGHWLVRDINMCCKLCSANRTRCKAHSWPIVCLPPRRHILKGK